MSLFTDPPLAHVGLTEVRRPESRRPGAGRAKLPMSRVLRTEATDKTDGLHESPGQRERRSHLWASPWSVPKPATSWRPLADRNDGEASVHKSARRRLLAPHDGRRPRPSLRHRSGALGLTVRIKSWPASRLGGPPRRAFGACVARASPVKPYEGVIEAATIRPSRTHRG